MALTSPVDSFTYTIKDNEGAISNIATVNISIIPSSLSCNKSVLLDGNDWINIPDMNLSGDFTIEAWIKMAPGIDSFDALLGQEGAGPDINFYQQRIHLFIAQNPWDAITSNTFIQADSWTHVAITRLGSDLALYINGTLDATGAWAGVFPIKALGRGNRSSLVKFAGEMDEVRIWNIARSADDINQYYTQVIDPSTIGLLRYWNFNETGQAVLDSSNNFDGFLGIDGSDSNDDPTRLQSTAPLFDTCDDVEEGTPIANDDAIGPIDSGQEVTFDVLGNDSDNSGSLNPNSVSILIFPTNGTVTINPTTGQITYIHDGSVTTNDSFGYTVGNNVGLVSNIATVSIDINETGSVESCGKAIELDGINDWINIPDLTLPGNFTIEGWFKLAEGIDYKDAIFGQEGRGPDIHFSAGRVRLYAYGIRVTANTPLEADTWGHIAITRSGSDLTVYVNGVKDATGKWNGSLSIKAIGRGNRGFAKGMLDEIRIWQLARTETEISNSYNTSIDPIVAGLIGYWSFNKTHQIITDASFFANHGSLGANTSVGTDDPVRLVSTAPITENCDGIETPNTPPVANDDVAGSVDVGMAFSFNVTENDVDNDGNLNPTNVVIVTDPSAGMATVNADGTITYISTGTTATTDRLKYTVADSKGEISNEATVTIEVFGPAFEPGTPIASDDIIGPLVAGGTITFSVTDNDQGSNVNLLQASVSIVSTPTEGSATVNGDGTITYVSNSVTAVFDTLTYTVSDINGVTSNVATVSITVTDPEPAVNETPIAQSDDATFQSGKSVTIDILSNDSDPDGTIDKSSLIIVNEPNFGNVEIDSGTNKITYTHDGLTISNDSFTYTVKDNQGAVSNEATVFIDNEAIKKLLANDGSGHELFGTSVSISGNTAVIGSIESPSGVGSAYVFIREANGNWSQQAKLMAEDGNDSFFGFSVSVSGDTAVISARTVSNNDSFTGSAYIFTRGENGDWNQQARLEADDNNEENQFAYSAVSISGNTVVIGDRVGAGLVYIFLRDEDNNWNLHTKLNLNTLAPVSFGRSVSISGNTIAIGSLAHSVYIYVLDENDEWVQQARLVSNDSSRNHYFGISVSVSENTALIGAWNDDEKGTLSGSAYIFSRDLNGDWSQQAKLFADDASENRRFGYSVSISGDKAVIGGDSISSAPAYSFVKNENGDWKQQAKFLTIDGDGFDRFGRTVSIDEDTAIIGAFFDNNDNGIDSGSAYIFDLAETTASCSKAIELDGINDWINIPDLRLANDFTIEGWFKLAPGIDYKDAIFGQEGTGPDIHFSAGRVRLYAYGIRVTAKTPLIADTWGHIAITRSGSDLTVYINGVKDATGRWNGLLNIKAIGRGNRGFMKGMLDEIRIWELARTDAEISNSYNTNVDQNSAGLVGYWNFNETDQITSDSSSKANHGSLGASTENGTDDPIRLDETAPLIESCI